MSRSTLGAIAGAAIGFFVPGGGILAAQIGWTLGSFLFAEGGPDQQGPRLNDLQAETIEYGSDIPIVYGRARIAGFRMWQRDIREQANEEDAGGKGGGGATVTTFTYYGTWAVNLCEGPIVGIRKIWADSNLIYNLGDTSDLETIIASNRAANGIRIYTGSSTQEPDSLIQATQGAANTPAYRNTAYIVFDDFALEKYGNRIPNITAEVIGAGSIAFRKISQDYPVPEFDPSDSELNVATYIDQSNGILYAFHGQSPVKRYKIYVNGVIEDDGNLSLGFGSPRSPLWGVGDQASYFVTDLSFGNRDRCLLYTGFESSAITIDRFREPDNNGVSDVQLVSANGDYCIKDGFFYAVKRDTVNSEAYLYKAKIGSGIPDLVTGEYFPLTIINSHLSDLSSSAWSVAVSEDNIYLLNSNNIIQVFDLFGALQSTISFSASIAYSAPGHPDPCLRYSNDTLWLCSVDFVRSVGLDGSVTLWGTVDDKMTPVVSDAGSYGGIFLQDGVFYNYSATNSSVNYTDGFSVAFQLEALSTDGVSLSSIQSDICTRSGLTASDFDVTELTDTVEGYVISKNMSGRAATEPLQKAFLYDGAEIDGKIKFIKRGNSSIANISQDDLGAGDDVSENAQLTTTRQQDSELPSDVTIGYISNIRDYEVGTQASRRINFNTLNSLTQELPIVMSDDYAAKIADITHYNAWTEREKYNFSLTNEYIDLNPTDVITVNYNDEARIVRLTKISYGDALECEAVSEDAQIYSSDATAAEDDYVDQVVGLAGPTRVEYMDIPLLRNQDNDAGLYYAATGYFASWTGAQIFKSLDEGITYNSVASVFTASTIGVATNVLAESDPELWDRTGSLNINLANGSFSSTTEDGALRGSNTILYGNEVMNFVNATLESDGSYTIDTFIRGRRGTEWAVDSHAVGDRVVLLRESDIRRFEAILNTERTYKAVTINTFIDEAEEELVANNGVNLKPFSPVLISGTRDGSNNLTGTFTRRSRYITSPLWTPPLFEESQEYEIDIMDGVTVVRTISVTSTSFSYTAAQQTTDFGSPQADIEVNIYQLSSVIGRGYAGNATI